jgi:signal peptidase I
MAASVTRPPRGRWWKSTWLAALVIISLQIGLSLSLPVGWRGFSIPSASNMPSLMVGDIILAKIRPGYRPERGDLMLFRRKHGVWVKRVIGLPGDRIAVANGVVSINGHPAPRTDASSYTLAMPGSPPDPSLQPLRYTEVLPEGYRHPILALNDGSQFENVDEVVVPANSYYVAGDNRDNSEDSRVPGFGFVPATAVIGKARLIYWSPERSRILMNVR